MVRLLLLLLLLLPNIAYGDAFSEGTLQATADKLNNLNDANFTSGAELDPDKFDDTSATTTEQDAVFDPYVSSSQTTATDFVEEIQQLRYQIQQTLRNSTNSDGTENWYVDPPKFIEELGGLTAGDILWYDSDGVQRLALGSDGESLVTHGGNSSPEWKFSKVGTSGVDVQETYVDLLKLAFRKQNSDNVAAFDLSYSYADEFRDTSGINAVDSTYYSHNGSPNFDVRRDATDLVDQSLASGDDSTHDMMTPDEAVDQEYLGGANSTHDSDAPGEATMLSYETGDDGQHDITAPYSAQEVTCSGDYLTRGADFSSNGDGKEGILSFWIDFNGADGTQTYIYYSANGFFEIGKKATDKVYITGYHGSGALDIASDTAYTAASGRIHVLCSWDLANTNAWLYIDDADDLATGGTINDNTIDYTRTEHTFGAITGGGGQRLDADVADFYFNVGESLDLSVESNRRKFIDGSGGPVNLGSDGSTPTGTAPIWFMEGAVASWHTNDSGVGGGMTVSGGALGDGGMFGGGDSDQYAQSFTPSTNGTLTSVDLYLLDGSDSPDGDVTVSIEGDSSGPDGNVYGSAVSIDAGDLSSSKTYENFNLSDIIVTASDKYWIILERTNSAMQGTVSWRKDAGGGYSGGNDATSTDGGSSWAENSADMLFKIKKPGPQDFIAQSFVPSGDITATSIDLYLSKASGSSDDGTVEVAIQRNTVDGIPDGSDLSTGASIASSAVSTTADWINFNIADVSLTADTYWAVLERASETTGTIKWSNNTSGSYGNGADAISVDSGDTWVTAGHTNHDALFKLYKQGTDTYLGQSFIPSEALTITQIDVYLSKSASSSPDGTVSLELRTDSGGSGPTTTIVGSAKTKNVSALSTSKTLEVFDISDIAVSAEKYWIFLKRVSDTGGVVKWHYDSTGTYVDGEDATSSDAGSNWTVDAAHDALFKVWRSPGDTQLMTIVTTTGDVPDSILVTWGEQLSGGSITMYVSRDAGVTFQPTLSSTAICGVDYQLEWSNVDVTAIGSGTGIMGKAVITGAAELEAIGLAWE